MRSMTGFGVGEAPLSGDASIPASGKLSVEIRAVNHRYLDVRVRAPNQLADLANAVETLARERLTRGRFDVTVRVEAAALGAVSIHKERARSVFAALLALRDELAPGMDVPLSLLGAVPDLFVPSIEQQGDAVRAAVSVAFDSALAALDAMRLREGLALGDDIVRRLVTVRKLAGVVNERAPHVVDIYKKKLKDRAERLRLASDVELDPGRLEQEVALYADRVDICEELTRLESHVSHFETLLVSPDAVGRRLDFLLQEMAREANTIGAKSQDAGIAHSVVELKAEIERMREQVQNIE
ncbi:MAG TPA: YicC/YloC family endoribonuclease [Labilithrix sp.]|nr:YicC/YloC family endoribonuclease [Labilithrix sp.]